MINSEITDLDIDEFVRSLKKGDKVEVYTDGSCLGNPGPGGWAAVFILNTKRTNISGFEKNTTNNRMELMAAIMAVKTMPNYVHIDLYTDSTYVKNGMTVWVKDWEKNNWISASKKPVKNKDLWVELNLLSKDRDIEWIWVRGHSDCTNNNNADFIAKSAIVSLYMQES
jgi:ribonuclease HI